MEGNPLGESRYPSGGLKKKKKLKRGQQKNRFNISINLRSVFHTS
jgi:hypothetical protein